MTSYGKHVESDGPAGAAAKPNHDVMTYDVEYADKPVPAEGYASFADKIVRQGFVRKVLGAWPPHLPPPSNALFLCASM